MSCIECLLFCSGSLARCVFGKVHFDWVCPSLSFLQWNSKVLRADSVRFMIFYTMRKCKFCDLFLDGLGWSFSYLFPPLWIYKIGIYFRFCFCAQQASCHFSMHFMLVVLDYLSFISLLFIYFYLFLHRNIENNNVNRFVRSLFWLLMFSV